ncbi:MAG: ACP S-malonyltransferase [Myxococcota bacterium]
MTTLIWMFPGQSSRYPQMFRKVASLRPKLTLNLLEEASALLGRDVKAHYCDAKPSSVMFGCNRDVQIGVFLINHLFLQVLESEGFHADYSLGLSLGEWNHLVHIGALSFEDALRAVEARGRAYDQGPRGAMASVFPLDAETLEEAVEQARVHGQIEIVNFNSPRQQVISGEHAAIEAAMQIIEDEYFVQAVMIEKEVPMHASMFESAGLAFRAHLETLAFQTPTLPYLPNRFAAFQEQLTSQEWVDILSSHVYKPVFWRESIDMLVAHCVEPVFVEVGAKGVLYNLLDRRWHKGLHKIKMDSAEDTAAHQAQVLRSLHQLQAQRAAQHLTATAEAKVRTQTSSQ